jgi:hypothetical protein
MCYDMDVEVTEFTVKPAELDVFNQPFTPGVLSFRIYEKRVRLSQPTDPVTWMSE